jgi:hypothetical protein
MGIVERIKEIEAEMARTQKNKATGKLNLFTLLVNCNFSSSIGILYASAVKSFW